MKKHRIVTRSLIAAMLTLIMVISTGCNVLLLSPENQEVKQTAPMQQEQEAQTTEPATEPPTEEMTEHPTEPVTEAPTEVPTEAPTEVPTEAPTEAPTQAPTEPEAVVPEKLAAMLKSSGYTVEDLAARECTQLITVESSGNTCRLRYYHYENDQWICNEALSCSGYVGRNGVTANKREGDGKTPAGLYGVGDAFYIYSAPDTGLEMFKITEDTYWVDDPDSKYYNQHVEGTADKDWDSAEHMIGYNPAYVYGFVINYNMEQVYNLGSAIFFHISTGGGTAGCVSTAESYVLQYLALLDKECNPQILIQ